MTQILERCPRCGTGRSVYIRIGNRCLRAWRRRRDPKLRNCPTCGQEMPYHSRLRYYCLYCGYVGEVVQ